MSLADELLADLEADGDEYEDKDAEEMDTIEEIEEVDETVNEPGAALYERVTSIARLRSSQRFQNLKARLEKSVATERDQIYGPVESDPEYQLVVEANNVAAEIDSEINVIHKFVRDKYCKRFPELESLVPAPLEYLALVRELGNDILSKSQNKDLLARMLLPATVIVVSVTASTTQGQQLDKGELEAVVEACDMAVELQETKIIIFQFVEQRMTLIAPNLSAIVGAATAAKLMGQAGGLTQLAKMPACNILVLGQTRRTLSGFSSTAVLPHTGFLYYTAIVQGLPPDLRRKAARLLSTKCALAARVDAVHSDPDGEAGRRLNEAVMNKLEKLVEPPNSKRVKPLPKPLDQASKKRGGRRVRKMKERMGLTEMRRKANRMTFAELGEDVLQTDIGFSLGQLKASGTAGGRLRAPQVDEKSRVRMSKLLQKNLAKSNAVGGGVTSVRSKVSGTSSSITFTPVQGLEIVNPQANEKKVSEANAKYFASNSGFLKVQTPMPGASKDAA